MVLHHVAHGAGSVIKFTTALDAQLLGNRQLHVRYRLASPQRLKQGVGKTQSQQVLHCFLAQVMIYTINLVFGKHAGYRIVDRPRGQQIMAERLLQYQPRLRQIDIAGGKIGADRLEQRWRSRQIKHRYRFASCQRLCQQPITGAVQQIQRQISDARQKTLPVRLVLRTCQPAFHVGDSTLADPGQVILLAEILLGDTDDAAVLMQLPFPMSNKQRRKNLPHRQVAGRSEKRKSKRNMWLHQNFCNK